MSPADKPTRREFLVTTSSAALGAAVPLTGQKDLLQLRNSNQGEEAKPPYSIGELLESGPQRTFTGDKVAQIAMPIGGIGTGCICFNGYGGLQDFNTLDYSHGDGTFHIDTANPWFIPIGTVLHTVVDLVGGHTWLSGGIPRHP